MSQPAPAGEASNAQLDLEPEPEPKTTERLEPEQLDGGYGWLIVFGAWLTFFWVFGLFYSFGVLFTSFLCPKEGEGSLGGSLGDAGVCEDGGFGASRSAGWFSRSAARWLARSASSSASPYFCDSAAKTLTSISSSN